MLGEIEIRESLPGSKDEEEIRAELEATSTWSAFPPRRSTGPLSDGVHDIIAFIAARSGREATQDAGLHELRRSRAQADAPMSKENFELKTQPALSIWTKRNPQCHD